MLSGYRALWLMAIFDLPVTTKAERKKAAAFRNNLLDFGFQMVQFSVYMKSVASKEQAKAAINRIKSKTPYYGNVKVLTITDKQFGNIVSLGNRVDKNIRSEQFLLF